MRNTFKLLFIITTLSFSLFNAHALTKQDIAEKALNSTVVVVVEDKQGNTLQFGSGFIIDGGMVVSNHHVVSGGFSGYVIHNDKAFKILGTLSLDDKNDLVLLKIDKHKIPPLSIYKGSDLKVGANVFVAGNPLGMSGTFSEGMLSSIRNIKGKELYQITAPISKGSSGGPVLNDNGTVIGVVVSLLKNGQNINFAVPNTYLNSLINNKGSLTPLSSITPKSAEVIEPQVINTKPIINEEGKLTDICCAFGVVLGNKLNPELLDTEILIEEDLKDLSIKQLESLLLKEEWSPLNRSMIKLMLRYKGWLDLYAKEGIKLDGLTQRIADHFPGIRGLEKFKETEKKGFNTLIKIIDGSIWEEDVTPNISLDFIPENPYDGFDIYKVYLIDKDSLIYKIIAYGVYENYQSCYKEKNILVDIILNKYESNNNTYGKESTHFYNNNKKIIASCVGDELTLIYEDSELKSLKDKIYKKKLRSQRDSSGI